MVKSYIGFCQISLIDLLKDSIMTSFLKNFIFQAAKHKTKQLDEDAFIELLQSRSHETKSHVLTSSCKQVYSPSKAKEESTITKSSSLKAKTPSLVKPDSHYSQSSKSRAALSPQKTVTSTISMQESHGLPDGITNHSNMSYLNHIPIWSDFSSLKQNRGRNVGRVMKSQMTQCAFSEVVFCCMCM